LLLENRAGLLNARLVGQVFAGTDEETNLGFGGSSGIDAGLELLPQLELCVRGARER